MSSDHDWDRPAPGGLHLVQQLVNSADLEEGTDELSDPEALGAWLGEHDLAAAGERFDAAGLERVIAFREAVRRLLLSHNGGELDREAVATLDALGGGACVHVEFGADGAPALVPCAGGVDGALARLFAAIARAQVEGTWERLKVCPASTCRWAFYDFSRNHSRTWCTMSVCGNRAKARTYRRRTRAG
jgi:predicted RNA-binding Zn ribbon-like protein